MISLSVPENKKWSAPFDAILDCYHMSDGSSCPHPFLYQVTKGYVWPGIMSGTPCCCSPAILKPGPVFLCKPRLQSTGPTRYNWVYAWEQAARRSDTNVKNDFPSKAKQHKGSVRRQMSLTFLYHLPAAVTEALYNLASKQPLSSSPCYTPRLQMQRANGQ